MGRLLLSRFIDHCLVFALVAYGALAHAEIEDTTWLDEINWHGFVSQSFILTDENNFLGSSSDGSFKFNSAGLNASWKPSNSLQLSVQGLYKQIGSAQPKGTRLDSTMLSLIGPLLMSSSMEEVYALGDLKTPTVFLMKHEM